MDKQCAYVGSTAELKMKPSEYLSSGRYFCSVERHEGADMLDAVRGFIGDDVLMYASDYPHSECQFPETVDNFLKWDMPPAVRAKLMAGNADRLFKRTCPQPDRIGVLIRHPFRVIPAKAGNHGRDPATSRVASGIGDPRQPFA